MPKLTRQQAIEANCKDCVYDPNAGGTWRDQTENCGIYKCALYEYRPLSSATKQKIKEERIAAMTPEERAEYEAKCEAAKTRLHGQTT